MRNEKSGILIVFITMGALLLFGLINYLTSLPISLKLSKLHQEITNTSIAQNSTSKETSLLEDEINSLTQELDDLRNYMKQQTKFNLTQGSTSKETSLLEGEIKSLTQELDDLRDYMKQQTKLSQDLFTENQTLAAEKEELFELLQLVQASTDNFSKPAYKTPNTPAPKPVAKPALQRDIENSLTLATVSFYNKDWGSGTADIQYPNAIQEGKTFLVRRKGDILGALLVTEVTETKEAVFEPLANNFNTANNIETGDELIAVPAGFRLR